MATMSKSGRGASEEASSAPAVFYRDALLAANAVRYGEFSLRYVYMHSERVGAAQFDVFIDEVSKEPVEVPW